MSGVAAAGVDSTKGRPRKRAMLNERMDNEETFVWVGSGEA